MVVYTLTYLVLLQDFFLGRAHLLNLTKGDYQRFSGEKYFGWFLLGKPVLAIRNIELLKHILVKDFNHFVDRTNADITQLFSGGGELDKVFFYTYYFFIQ
jgi:hypothetical protein